MLGCELYLRDVGGVIVETEAYGPDDPACHAFNGMTERNQPLFGAPATVYVYRSYGIHLLLNLVAEAEGTPGAVLIRAIEPREGLEAMIERRGTSDSRGLCSGPGKVGEALGVGLEMNTLTLDEIGMTIVAPDQATRETEIAQGARVGISRGLDREWRYWISDSEYVSKPRRAAAGSETDSSTAT